jgi:hypothetical protein
MILGIEAKNINQVIFESTKASYSVILSTYTTQEDVDMCNTLDNS